MNDISDERWMMIQFWCTLSIFLSLSACSRSLSLSIESHTSSNVFHFPWNSRFRVASSLHHYQSDVVMVFTNNVLNWLISVNLPVFCVQITPSSDVCWYLPRWWQYFTINNIMIWRFEERSIVRDSLETVIIIVLYFHFNFWFWCWIFRSFHRIQRHRTGFANFFFAFGSLKLWHAYMTWLSQGVRVRAEREYHYCSYFIRLSIADALFIYLVFFWYT